MTKWSSLDIWSCQNRQAIMTFWSGAAILVHVSATNPITRHDRRRQHTRDQLVAAARQVITARGVAGLRIGDLTEIADVGKGSFYNHFDSKEALVDAVVGDMLEDLALAVLADTAAYDDAAVGASVADRRFIRLANDEPDTARLIVNLAHAETVFEQTLRPYARIALERGITSGRLAMPNLEMALIVLFGSSFATMRAILDGTAPDRADELHAEAMLILFGVPPAEAAEISRRPLP
jgi:AcrR family transcriptional regulator